MARREGASAIVDFTESIKQLENETRILTSNKQALQVSVGELEAKRDGLLKEVAELESKVKQILSEAQAEADKLVGIEKDKVAKANAREADSVNKQIALDEKLKRAGDLIKSNEGLKNNLDLQLKDVKERLEKIGAFVELLKNKLSEIK